MNEAPTAGYIFLKILAPGLSGESTLALSDAKAELASFMSSVLYELSAEVEGLDIGNVLTGAMELLIRSKDEVWVSAHEKPYLLRLVANAYTIAMSQLELAGSYPMLQDAFDGASLATVHSMFAEHSRAFYKHAGLLSYGSIKIKTVIHSTLEASTCAALCVNDAECSTFAFSFLERLCFILTDAQLSLCNSSMSAACLERNSELRDQLSQISRCRHNLGAILDACR